ncbi:MAG: hypothetical protein HY042_07925, partial [Spirochaetia bacterium]|nr:hypothetical protein [Spirochaetia bacterium]
MQSVLHRIRKFAIGAPVLTGISFLALFLAVYLAGVKIPNALFSDMVAKWLQTKNLIETGNAANCRYSESIDPDFNFIPGPSYFYVIKNQKCWNFYPVPFAYLAAPFDRLLPLHGLYLMNFLLLACVVFFAARTMKVLLPDRP